MAIVAIFKKQSETYFESAQEFVVTDATVSIPIKVVQNVLSLFLGHVEAVVDEAPAEVFHVETTVAIVIHGLEDASNALDAAS